MMNDHTDGMKIIAHIRTDFPEKFGLPRQSGLVKELKGRIVFLPEYRNADALRGIEGYDYLYKDANRKYGVAFAGFDVRFCVKEGRLTVFEVRQQKDDRD